MDAKEMIDRLDSGECLTEGFVNKVIAYIRDAEVEKAARVEPVRERGLDLGRCVDAINENAHLGITDWEPALRGGNELGQTAWIPFPCVAGLAAFYLDRRRLLSAREAEAAEGGAA